MKHARHYMSTLRRTTVLLLMVAITSYFTTSAMADDRLTEWRAEHPGDWIGPLNDLGDGIWRGNAGEDTMTLLSTGRDALEALMITAHDALQKQDSAGPVMLQITRSTDQETLLNVWSPDQVTVQITYPNPDILPPEDDSDPWADVQPAQ